MFAFIVSLVDSIIEHRRYVTVFEELSQLTDRELKDIGMIRADIPRVAMGLPVYR